MIALIFIVINLIILKVLDINGTSVLLTTDLAEDKTYMKWCNYWDQVTSPWPTSLFPPVIFPPGGNMS